jgi:hypothetical protein
MVNARKIHPDCQIKDVHSMANGPQESISPGKSVRLFGRKLLGPRNIRKIKLYADDFLNWYARLRSKPIISPTLPVNATTATLKAGDQVRVRSKDEIRATLNRWGQLKGCSFAPEMVQYCETNQKVLKPVERFVDERDLRARKTKGIVLLEGIVCQGTATLGSCDRNCFFFWREEWLEQIE